MVPPKDLFLIGCCDACLFHYRKVKWEIPGLGIMLPSFDLLIQLNFTSVNFHSQRQRKISKLGFILIYKRVSSPVRVLEAKHEREAAIWSQRIRMYSFGRAYYPIREECITELSQQQKTKNFFVSFAGKCAMFLVQAELRNEKQSFPYLKNRILTPSYLYGYPCALFCTTPVPVWPIPFYFVFDYLTSGQWSES